MYRYDGKLFQQFTIKDGLSSNTVWSVLEDQSGNIWFGTADGICRYDGKRISRVLIALAKGSHLFPYTAPNNNLSEKNSVFSIIQDNSGIIWFGTTTGVYCYDGKYFTRFIEQAGLINSRRLSLLSVQCMFQDKNGNIWFGSEPMAFEGICRYDGKSLVNFKPKEEGWIRNIIEDINGNIWFGTRRYGACCYDGKTLLILVRKLVLAILC